MTSVMKLLSFSNDGTDIQRLTSIVTRLTLCLLCGFLLSCEVPTEIYDNPLDEEAAEEAGIETPALVFFPDSVGVTAGSSVSLQIFALEVADVGGAHIQVAYDKNKVSLSSVTVGDFFNTTSEPVFIYEDNPDDGFVDIYSSFLGQDSVTVSGTGNLAYLVFSTTTPGQSTLTYTAECELVDAEDNPVLLNGFGEGVINAQ